MRSTAPTAKIHRSKVMEHRTSECRAISTQSAKFRHPNGCNSTTHTSFPRSRWNFVGLADFYTSQPPAMYLATTQDGAAPFRTIGYMLWTHQDSTGRTLRPVGR